MRLLRRCHRLGRRVAAFFLFGSHTGQSSVLVSASSTFGTWMTHMGSVPSSAAAAAAAASAPAFYF